MRCARSGCERPEKTMSRFHGPRSIQWPGRGCAAVACASRPGSASSVVVSVAMLLVDPAFLRLLPWCEPRERARRNIVRDHRSGCNPDVVADLDRCIERIVDTGPDVPADPRLRLRLSGLVLEVRGDVAGGDVRARADLGVAEIGQVRHLRVLPDAGPLELH